MSARQQVQNPWGTVFFANARASALPPGVPRHSCARKDSHNHGRVGQKFLAYNGQNECLLFENKAKDLLLRILGQRMRAGVGNIRTPMCALIFFVLLNKRRSTWEAITGWLRGISESSYQYWAAPRTANNLMSETPNNSHMLTPSN